MESDDQAKKRRRVDRITAGDYLEGLAERDAAELRAMRDDCREEESRFSYNRRLLQARIDIVKAELARREGGGESLMDALPRILADDPGPRADVAGQRNSPVYEPGEVGRRRDDQLAADAMLARLPDLTDDELRTELEELTDEERRVSEVRRAVLDRLDTLQEELVRRYREGGVEGIVGSVTSSDAE